MMECFNKYDYYDVRLKSSCECCGKHGSLKITYSEKEENVLRDVIYEYIDYECIECGHEGYIEEYY